MSIPISSFLKILFGPSLVLTSIVIPTPFPYLSTNPGNKGSKRVVVISEKESFDTERWRNPPLWRVKKRESDVYAEISAYTQSVVLLFKVKSGIIVDGTVSPRVELKIVALRYKSS